MSEYELYHFGVKGMKWGVRKKYQDGSINNAIASVKKTINRVARKAKTEIGKASNTEIGRRGKAAIDVLMNGDKDWMGNSIYSNSISKEVRNRGRAAVERLLYSQEQIDNKKFFGRYDF